MKTVKTLLAALMLACSVQVQANDDALRHTTDVLCLLPDATALGVAIAKHDNEYANREPRFYASVAFNGSTFLMKRYGWKWGVPAYVVSSFVAWGRVHTDRHDWWDVLGGAAIGAGTAFIFTRPFMGNVDVAISPTTWGDRAYGLTATIQF